MKGLRVILFLVQCYTVVQPAAGQQRDTLQSKVQDDLEEALELFDPDDPDIDSEQLTLFLQDLAANPVDLNNADVHELVQVPGFNLKKARAVIRYRREVKPFESVRELTSVPGIGKRTAGKAAPYVTVGTGFELGKTLYSDPRYWTNGGRIEAYSRYQRDLQEASGYKKSPEQGGYTGSPVAYYQRIRYASDHLSLNLTHEKDAGEPFEGPAGFDYASRHFALEDNGRLKTLVAGDYSLSFGQGLVLWDGGSFGKGSDVAGSANRSARGVKPYTSAREAGYNRGVAATYGERLQFTGFWSSRRHSATPVDTGTSRLPASGGNHRTLSEQNRKNSLHQKLFGGHVQIDMSVGFIGMTGYYTRFDKQIRPSDGLHARYDFEGYSNYVTGIDYSLIAGPVLFFGEAARSKNGGIGWIGGLESNLETGTGLSLVYRNYGKEFQSFMGDGFGEASGSPQNEEGIYLGIRHTFGGGLSARAYIDQYRFPGPRFGTVQPSQGYDWLVRMDAELTKDMMLYFQARKEIRDDEYDEMDAFGRVRRKMNKALRSSLRAHLEYRVAPEVRLRIRGEAVESRRAGATSERGYLLFQDLRLIPADNLKIDTRLTVFDTDSFATRVYQFENDLLYLFSSRSLFNRGQRLYLLVNYKPFAFLEFWAKFGVTSYEDQNTVGSGLNEIEGSKKSEIGIQARIRF